MIDLRAKETPQGSESTWHVPRSPVGQLDDIGGESSLLHMFR